MPTYEYVCRDCATPTEVRATVAEKTAGLDVTCAACGGDDLRQLLSSVGVLSRPLPEAAPSGGGCCGGGACGCAH